MIDYCSILKAHGIPITSFLEIGSRDGHDAARFASVAEIRDVYVVEPAPQSFRAIVASYPWFKTFNVALSNRNGRAMFHNVVEEDMIRRGMSSLMDRDVYAQLKTDTIEVEVMTGSSLFERIGERTITACKIDVEGHAFEVLEGFGDTLARIQSMHLECEVVPVWDRETLFADVRPWLESKGYRLITYGEYNQPTTQCDSIWIHRSALHWQPSFAAGL